MFENEELLLEVLYEKGEGKMDKKEIAKYIDHTLLKPEARNTDVENLCREAIEHSFAAVCINSAYVKLAAGFLKGREVKVCCVVGFPLGAALTSVKAFETEEAINNGAEEIDMVLNIGALKGENNNLVEEDIAAVVKAARGKTVKVIIEAALLSQEEKIAACKMAEKAGAHFVKTSTGFGPGGATLEDVSLMKKTVGPNMKVKASGGIRSYDKAIEMIKAGADRLGTSSGIDIIRGISK